MICLTRIEKSEISQETLPKFFLEIPKFPQKLFQKLGQFPGLLREIYQGDSPINLPDVYPGNHLDVHEILLPEVPPEIQEIPLKILPKNF